MLQAAGTKWNFLPFRPGLVGGHCIGVDPYYLIDRADAAGIHPQLIDTARRINNTVGAHVAGRVLAMLRERGVDAASARVLVLGLTFKEDCPDLRNSKVLDVVASLRAAGTAVDVHDPWADAAAAREEFGIDVVATPRIGTYDAIVLALSLMHI